ncbi:large-conductance mechanosensitive channel protein MscL [Solitalea canadensis]|uniref:Large-conductance mechanosensitive channel n=1 Tax=Solitalea canadensis (strain ATCC 29591 / DSM 3403 / JCM 21819 / LMG 8368 / NBRC 15130 / NCIMB 12057 / USAM 9D) TaxID=929556 RepID=H8KRM1_SOLCM|nr:large-conductance mechanosensitive channel protein MscL [Solitalea canadensis]AFD07602.1 large conductance mechanosensitive channel protein [Solitalea canadensis DSM 3403]
MSFIKEFKEFAMRGNVIDLAVGVVIGGAFGKIVTSLVDDIIMPPIGYLIGGFDFKAFKITLKEAVVDAAGKVTPEVAINLGNFIQVLIQFVIIAFAIFIAIKAINTLKKKEEAAAAPTPPTEALLAEIRDLLKNRPL